MTETNAFSWLVGIIPKLAQLWSWLTTPFTNFNGLEIAPLTILSTGVLTGLLVLALIRG